MRQWTMKTKMKPNSERFMLMALLLLLVWSDWAILNVCAEDTATTAETSGGGVGKSPNTRLNGPAKPMSPEWKTKTREAIKSTFFAGTPHPDIDSSPPSNMTSGPTTGKLINPFSKTSFDHYFHEELTTVKPPSLQLHNMKLTSPASIPTNTRSTIMFDDYLEGELTIAEPPSIQLHKLKLTFASISPSKQFQKVTLTSPTSTSPNMQSTTISDDYMDPELTTPEHPSRYLNKMAVIIKKLEFPSITGDRINQHLTVPNLATSSEEDTIRKPTISHHVTSVNDIINSPNGIDVYSEVKLTTPEPPSHPQHKIMPISNSSKLMAMNHQETTELQHSRKPQFDSKLEKWTNTVSGGLDEYLDEELTTPEPSSIHHKLKLNSTTQKNTLIHDSAAILSSRPPLTNSLKDYLDGDLTTPEPSKQIQKVTMIKPALISPNMRSTIIFDDYLEDELTTPEPPLRILHTPTSESSNLVSPSAEQSGLNAGKTAHQIITSQPSNNEIRAQKGTTPRSASNFDDNFNEELTIEPSKPKIPATSRHSATTFHLKYMRQNDRVVPNSRSFHDIYEGQEANEEHFEEQTTSFSGATTPQKSTDAPRIETTTSSFNNVPWFRGFKEGMYERLSNHSKTGLEYTTDGQTVMQAIEVTPSLLFPILTGNGTKWVSNGNYRQNFRRFDGIYEPSDQATATNYEDILTVQSTNAPPTTILDEELTKPRPPIKPVHIPTGSTSTPFAVLPNGTNNAYITTPLDLSEFLTYQVTTIKSTEITHASTEGKESFEIPFQQMATTDENIEGEHSPTVLTTTPTVGTTSLGYEKAQLVTPTEGTDTNEPEFDPTPGTTQGIASSEETVVTQAKAKGVTDIPVEPTTQPTEIEESPGTVESMEVAPHSTEPNIDPTVSSPGYPEEQLTTLTESVKVTKPELEPSPGPTRGIASSKSPESPGVTQSQGEGSTEEPTVASIDSGILSGLSDEQRTTMAEFMEAASQSTELAARPSVGISSQGYPEGQLGTPTESGEITKPELERIPGTTQGIASPDSPVEPKVTQSDEGSGANENSLEPTVAPIENEEPPGDSVEQIATTDENVEGARQATELTVRPAVGITLPGYPEDQPVTFTESTKVTKPALQPTPGTTQGIASPESPVEPVVTEIALEPNVSPSESEILRSRQEEHRATTANNIQTAHQSTELTARHITGVHTPEYPGKQPVGVPTQNGEITKPSFKPTPSTAQGIASPEPPEVPAMTQGERNGATEIPTVAPTEYEEPPGVPVEQVATTAENMGAARQSTELTARPIAGIISTGYSEKQLVTPTDSDEITKPDLGPTTGITQGIATPESQVEPLVTQSQRKISTQILLESKVAPTESEILVRSPVEQSPTTTVNMEGARHPTELTAKPTVDITLHGYPENQQSLLPSESGEITKPELKHAPGTTQGITSSDSPVESKVTQSEGNRATEIPLEPTGIETEESSGGPFEQMGTTVRVTAEVRQYAELNVRQTSGIFSSSDSAKVTKPELEPTPGTTQGIGSPESEVEPVETKSVGTRVTEITLEPNVAKTESEILRMTPVEQRATTAENIQTPRQSTRLTARPIAGITLPGYKEKQLVGAPSESGEITKPELKPTLGTTQGITSPDSPVEPKVTQSEGNGANENSLEPTVATIENEESPGVPVEQIVTTAENVEGVNQSTDLTARPAAGIISSGYALDKLVTFTESPKVTKPALQPTPDTTQGIAPPESPVEPVVTEIALEPNVSPSESEILRRPPVEQTATTAEIIEVARQSTEVVAISTDGIAITIPGDPGEQLVRASTVSGEIAITEFQLTPGIAQGFASPGSPEEPAMTQGERNRATEIPTVAPTKDEEPPGVPVEQIATTAENMGAARQSTELTARPSAGIISTGYSENQLVTPTESDDITKPDLKPTTGITQGIATPESAVEPVVTKSEGKRVTEITLEPNAAQTESEILHRPPVEQRATTAENMGTGRQSTELTARPIAGITSARYPEKQLVTPTESDEITSPELEPTPGTTQGSASPDSPEEPKVTQSKGKGATATEIYVEPSMTPTESEESPRVPVEQIVTTVGNVEGVRQSTDLTARPAAGILSSGHALDKLVTFTESPKVTKPALQPTSATTQGIASPKSPVEPVVTEIALEPNVSPTESEILRRPPVEQTATTAGIIEAARQSTEVAIPTDGITIPGDPGEQLVRASTVSGEVTKPEFKPTPGIAQGIASSLETAVTQAKAKGVTDIPVEPTIQPTEIDESPGTVENMEAVRHSTKPNIAPAVGVSSPEYPEEQLATLTESAKVTKPELERSSDPTQGIASPESPEGPGVTQSQGEGSTEPTVAPIDSGILSGLSDEQRATTAENMEAASLSTELAARPTVGISSRGYLDEQLGTPTESGEITKPELEPTPGTTQEIASPDSPVEPKGTQSDEGSGANENSLEPTVAPIENGEPPGDSVEQIATTDENVEGARQSTELTARPIAGITSARYPEKQLVTPTESDEITSPEFEPTPGTTQGIASPDSPEEPKVTQSEGKGATATEISVEPSMTPTESEESSGLSVEQLAIAAGNMEVARQSTQLTGRPTVGITAPGYPEEQLVTPTEIPEMNELEIEPTLDTTGVSLPGYSVGFVVTQGDGKGATGILLEPTLEPTEGEEASGLAVEGIWSTAETVEETRHPTELTVIPTVGATYRFPEEQLVTPTEGTDITEPRLGPTDGIASPEPSEGPVVTQSKDEGATDNPLEPTVVPNESEESSGLSVEQLATTAENMEGARHPTTLTVLPAVGITSPGYPEEQVVTPAESTELELERTPSATQGIVSPESPVRPVVTQSGEKVTGIRLQSTLEPTEGSAIVSPKDDERGETSQASLESVSSKSPKLEPSHFSQLSVAATNIPTDLPPTLLLSTERTTPKVKTTVAPPRSEVLTMEISSIFQNPAFPKTDTKSYVSGYTVFLQKRFCALRVEFLEAVFAPRSMGGGCSTDSVVIFGVDGPSSPFCGLLKSYQITVRQETLNNVTVEVAVRSWSYRWKMRLVQIPCANIKPYQRYVSSDEEICGVKNPTEIVRETNSKQHARTIPAHRLLHFKKSSVKYLMAAPYFGSIRILGKAVLDKEAVKLVRGMKCDVNEYPWQAVLKIRGQVICGAVIINEEWVMTAGHCVQLNLREPLTSIMKVVLGEHDLRSEADSNRVTVGISRIVLHEHSQAEKNDIALIKLNSKQSWNWAVRPICLPNNARDKFEGENGVATGWGKTYDGVMSNLLREVDLPIVSNEHCSQMWSSVVTPGAGDIINERMLCAGGVPIGACSEDGGGPLVAKKDSKWILVGVASFGFIKGCALDGVPIVFARVTEYLDWMALNFADSQDNGISGRSLNQVDLPLPFPPPLSSPPPPSPHPVLRTASISTEDEWDNLI